MTLSTVTPLSSQPAVPSTASAARAGQTGFQDILATHQDAGAAKGARQPATASRHRDDRTGAASPERPAYPSDDMPPCGVSGAGCLVHPARALQHHPADAQASHEDTAPLASAGHSVVATTPMPAVRPLSMTAPSKEASEAFQPLKETIMNKATPPYHPADGRLGQQPIVTATTGTNGQAPTGYASLSGMPVLPSEPSAAGPSSPRPTPPVSRRDPIPGSVSAPGALRAVSIMQNRLESALPDPAATPLTDFIDALDNMAARRAQTMAGTTGDLHFNLAGSPTPGNSPPHAGDTLLHDGVTGAVITTLPAAYPLPGPAGPATASGAMTAGLGTPGWAPELSRHFAALAQRPHDHAHRIELRLDPPELGPLRITLQVQDHVAHAVFVSAHASVRQAVENALPQLQEHLAQAGLSLGDTSVSDQGLSDPAFGGDDTQARTVVSRAGVRPNAAGSPLAPGEGPRMPPASDALVDTYA